MYKLNLRIYYTDFLITGLLFCLSFYITFISGNIFTFCLSFILLYRFCCFTHEIAHQNKNKEFKLFKILWNLTGGLLMLQPSIRFTKPHLEHHTTGIFATKNDPQYPLIFSDIKLAVIIFVFLPFLLPIYHLILCIIPWKNTRINRLISDTVFSTDEYKEIQLYELYYSVIYILSIFLAPKFVVTFYLVSVGSWFLSVLRIPLEHPLNYYKKTSNQKDQEVLSYTHKNIFYVIVQPLGLRFHTLHHMKPKLPYYKLKA